MRFPGYWVYEKDGKVVLLNSVFDETELDPATDWKEAWQNQGGDPQCKGYVDLERALTFAASLLAAAEGRDVTPAELELALRFEPVWTDDRCEFASLSCLLNPQVSHVST